MPYAVVQLTDLHMGSSWGEDPVVAVGRVVAAVRRTLGVAPDAVIVTGDLANTPADREYEQARELLGQLGAPLYVLPGNHDDRDGLRRYFEFPETCGERLRYAVKLGPMRLIALDTKRAGSDAGELDAAQLEWLEGTLAEDRSTPTLLAMHHPPIVIGIPPMDAVGITAAERDALAAILSRHPQVQMIAAGHVHRTVVGQLGFASVLALASTDVQLALELSCKEMHFVSEPPCFGLHLLLGGRFASHVQPVDRSPRQA